LEKSLPGKLTKIETKYKGKAINSAIAYTADAITLPVSNGTRPPLDDRDHEVTKEEFAAALGTAFGMLSESNLPTAEFAIAGTLLTTMSYAGIPITANGTSVLNAKDGKIYRETTTTTSFLFQTETEHEQGYYAYDDGKWYNYEVSEDDGEWYYEEVSYEEVVGGLSGYGGFGSFESIGVGYDLFEYKNGRYVLKPGYEQSIPLPIESGVAIDSMEVSLIFTDNVLVAYEIKAAITEPETGMKINISMYYAIAYESDDVTLPEATLIESGGTGE
jgi:hypothetical protein